MKRPILVTVTFTTFAMISACSNAKLSADHSAAASVYGSAAVGESVTSAVAVPLVVSGSTLLVSGAALASASTTQPQNATPKPIAPNGAPTLN